MLDRTGDRSAAESSYREALGLFRSLTADYPTVPDYKADFAGCLQNLGRLLALGQHRRIVEATQRLERVYLESLANDYRLIALVAGRSGDLARAAEAAEELPRVLPNDLTEYLRAAHFLAQCSGL